MKPETLATQQLGDGNRIKMLNNAIRGDGPWTLTAGESTARKNGMIR